MAAERYLTGDSYHGRTGGETKEMRTTVPTVRKEPRKPLLRGFSHVSFQALSPHLASCRMASLAGPQIIWSRNSGYLNSQEEKKKLFGKSTNTQRSSPLSHLDIFVSFTGDELWVEFVGGGLRFWMRSFPVFLFLPVSDMVFMGRCIIYLHYIFKICPLFIWKASPKNHLFWLIYIYFFTHKFIFTVAQLGEKLVDMATSMSLMFVNSGHSVL